MGDASKVATGGAAEAPWVTVEQGVVVCGGTWTTSHLDSLERQVNRLDWPKADTVYLDASHITQFDTSGAWMMRRAMTLLAERNQRAEVVQLAPAYQGLLHLVDSRLTEEGGAPKRRRPWLLERMGRSAVGRFSNIFEIFAFAGETVIAFLRTIVHPQRIRLRAMIGVLENHGVHALPIVGLLSFLLGIVIAYQGGIQLKSYGANIFIVELVTITMLRELSPLIAAIIIAGRTGSAYTAEIGTMRVTEEVDALKTLGIAPMDLLVLPKVIGLMIAMPLLTLWADALGVFGGMVMAKGVLDVSFVDFVDRIQREIGINNLLVGLGKAPFFAMIISMVGCYQGFQVSGGADAVGRHTTISVVQSIFLVIICDAVFSVFFSVVGV